MRVKWLNLILKISARIHDIKERLIKSHGFSSVLNVIYLFLLSFVFILVTTPFNLVSKSKKGDVELRKTLSLSYLLPTIIIWILKLLSVGAIFFTFGYEWISVQPLGSSNEIENLRIYELSEVQSDLEISNYSSNLSKFPNIRLTLSGSISMDEYDKVLVSMNSSEDSYIRYFIEDINNDEWVIEKNFLLNEVPLGSYNIEIAGVKSDSMERSEFESLGEIKFELPLWFKVLASLDLILNYLIIAFVAISMFLTLIII